MDSTKVIDMAGEIYERMKDRNPVGFVSGIRSRQVRAAIIAIVEAINEEKQAEKPKKLKR